eukprot:TRINITY_DN3469_c0_g1_i2.p1 TRINITY_DN3469_c0_g1~~TRINITY_DN3469_c0_g1_i2.p1  ORF type:complete len:457 (-),score=41.38 TRINITY_DN3469_c0_g1_i2:221-1546(-)
MASSETGDNARRDGRRSVFVLSAAWASAFSTQTSAVASLTLAAESLSAPDGFATLPLAFVVFGQALGQMFLPLEIQYVGRRMAYVFGCILGVLGAGLVTMSLLWFRSWISMTCGGAIMGCSLSHAQNYRFGATVLMPSDPANAMGIVLFGGVFGALVGPGLISQAKDLLDADYAGIYLICCFCHVLGAMLVCFLRFPASDGQACDGQKQHQEPIELGKCHDSEENETSNGNEKKEQSFEIAEAKLPCRSLFEIYREPDAQAATVVVMFSWVLMCLLMAPTPIVMRRCGHSYFAVTLTMMGHMFFMFAPSPLAANLVRRWGSMHVALIGCAAGLVTFGLLAISASVTFFVLGLSFLGIMWNFLFLAGSSMVAKSFHGPEGPKIQASCDFCGFVAAGTFTSFSLRLVDSLGWLHVQFLCMGMLIIPSGVALAVMFRSKPQQSV